jgi:translation initiation factor 2B subunit (eIF-2B alpha/beta/delta family)
MDQAAIHRLQKAAAAARQAAHQARLSNCDVGDIDEAIEAVDQELARAHPNKNTLTLYLNSVARSLIADPSARDAREQIDHALRASGLPATWEQ